MNGWIKGSIMDNGGLVDGFLAEWMD